MGIFTYILDFCFLYVEPASSDLSQYVFMRMNNKSKFVRLLYYNEYQSMFENIVERGINAMINFISCLKSSSYKFIFMNLLY